MATCLMVMGSSKGTWMETTCMQVHTKVNVGVTSRLRCVAGVHVVVNVMIGMLHQSRIRQSARQIMQLKIW